MTKKKLLINLEKPVVLHPQLAKVLGGIEEAIFVQQLYYWTDKGKNEEGWIYKSKKEWEEETALSRKKQDRVRKKLIEEGIIEVKKKKANGAPTLWYKLDIDRVNELLRANEKDPEGLMEKSQRGQWKSPNGANPYIGRTENTTENTTNNNSSKEELSSDQSDDTSFSKKIKIIREYFKQHFRQFYEKEPLWEFGKEEKLVKRFLKIYSLEDAFDLIDAFFTSDKLNDFPSLAVVFSTHTVNLWGSNNLIADYWKYKQFKQKRSEIIKKIKQ